MRKVISDQTVSWKLHFTPLFEMVPLQLSDLAESRLPFTNDAVIDFALLVPTKGPRKRARAVAYIRRFDVVEDGDDDVTLLVLALQHLVQFHEAALAGPVTLRDDGYRYLGLLDRLDQLGVDCFASLQRFLVPKDTNPSISQHGVQAICKVAARVWPSETQENFVDWLFRR